jgi:hypothetical protein
MLAPDAARRVKKTIHERIRAVGAKKEKNCGQKLDCGSKTTARTTRNERG